MIEISKRDWKLFRERVPDWQEYYMERLIKEYIEISYRMAVEYLVQTRLYQEQTRLC